MNVQTQLREAKNIIRADVKGWTTAKLCEVWAFNRDGRMDVLRPCCCILGVLSSPGALHRENCGLGHYMNLLTTPSGLELEIAYIRLAIDLDADARRRVLSSILAAELRRRSRLAEQAEAKVEIEVHA
jgi:hypothetical protein